MRPQTVLASETIFKSAMSPVLIWMHCIICAGGENLTCNCGYERGYSVLQVIEAVKTISGVDFPVKTCGRRAGDPAVIVASNALIKSKLGWNPKHDDLNEIIHQALDWERYLVSRYLNAWSSMRT